MCCILARLNMDDNFSLSYQSNFDHMESVQQEISLQQAIEQTARLSNLFHTTLGTKATVNAKGAFTMAYLSLCLEHREAILLLVGRGAIASATALQRPLVEALVIGAWIFNGANDSEIKALVQFDRSPPKFETMVQRLRKTHDFGKWFEVLRGHYSILGDYSHGHQRQLSRWIDRNAVAPRYTEGHMIEILRHSDVVGLMAAVHREKICDRPTDQLFKILEAAMLSRNYMPGAKGQ